MRKSYFSRFQERIITHFEGEPMKKILYAEKVRPEKITVLESEDWQEDDWGSLRGAGASNENPDRFPGDTSTRVRVCGGTKQSLLEWIIACPIF